jgi:DNA (cytosine-5)-methyltransferase 1
MLVNNTNFFGKSPCIWTYLSKQRETMSATIGGFIKKRRVELGYPLKKVADHLKIDTSTLGKIEKESRMMSFDLIPRLSEILETDEEKVKSLYYTTKVSN